MRRSNGQSQHHNNRPSDNRSLSDERQQTTVTNATDAVETTESEKQQSKEEVVIPDTENSVNTAWDKPMVRNAKIKEFKDFQDNFKVC